MGKLYSALGIDGSSVVQIFREGNVPADILSNVLYLLIVFVGGIVIFPRLGGQYMIIVWVRLSIGFAECFVVPGFLLCVFFFIS